MASDFTFLVVTDTHVHVQSDGPDWDCSWNTILNTRGAEILSIFVEDANAIAPDFVVHCGDLTNVSDEASYRAASEILSGLNCPFYLTLGNHDTYNSGARDLAAELFGLPRIVNSGEWRLILVDGVHWINKDGSVQADFDPDNYKDIITPDSELGAVRSEMERDPAVPTMCFTHPSLKFRPEAYPVPTHMGGEPVEGGLVMMDEEMGAPSKLGSIVDSYPCVKAAFCGHGHWHECLLGNSINGGSSPLYCQTAGLAEFPCEYRKIRLTSDRIDVETVKLSRGNFAELSYIPARGNRWTAGRPIDRSFSHEF